MSLDGSAKRLENGFGGSTAGVAAKGLKIKKAEFLPPFLPQIYHKLNLLMLWYPKYTIFCANRQN
ncbi:hypothetical protein GGR22_001284 [Flavobacterium gossypii]|uniref:Uncharacterized protein n=1 Tax=Flavobacterium gossypii TaxID=1646119 RepID=A0ABR6DN95_9FLAO|nr:hypothetical protein [Flavobacterium gossypii]